MPRYEENPRDRGDKPSDRGSMKRTRVREPYSPQDPPPPTMRSSRDYRYEEDVPPPSNYSSHPRSIPYKILCVSAIRNSVTDNQVKDALMREFSRYGEVSVRVITDNHERLGYVYFRSYNEAREARHSSASLLLFDRLVEIEPIHERRPRHSPTPEYPPHSSSRSQRQTPPPSSSHPRSSRNMSSSHHSSSSRSNLDRHQSNSNYNHRHQENHSSRDNQHRNHSVYGLNGSDNNGSSSTNNGSRNQQNSQQRDSKKEKFPNYLHHIPPEEDDKATRTLFVGNLEVSISDAELKKIFEKYGQVDDIDVKRPHPGQGNAYAFIKLLNLDMAHRAKVEMSGQYIGKFQCKIGYGKAIPTSRIWVGGLGPWTNLAQLEREFDRFGAIVRIDFVKGDTFAYIQYDETDIAQAACQEMRGFPLGGPDKRLRVDFADPIVSAVPAEETSPSAGAQPGASATSPSFFPASPLHAPSPVYAGSTGENRDQGSIADSWPSPARNGTSVNGDSAQKRVQSSEVDAPSPKRIKDETSEIMDSIDAKPELKCEPEKGKIPDSICTMNELMNFSSVAWTGALIIKNNAVTAKMSLCSGNPRLVDELLKDPFNGPVPGLKITQRLRLEKNKIEDVRKRVQKQGSEGSCVLLASASPSIPNLKEALGADMQVFTLKGLMTYLQKKEAAGVVTILKDSIHLGCAYIFYPCPFAEELIHSFAPNVQDAGSAEDMLTIVIVKGPNS